MRQNGEWDEGIPEDLDPSYSRLVGETIVCFGWDEWDRNQQAWNQILRRLAHRNQVIYVPPPLERTEVFGARFSGKVRLDGLRNEVDHLYVYHFPHFLPRFYKPSAFANWMERCRIRALRKALRGIDASAPILYILHPKFRSYIGHFNEKMVLYHVFDDYSGYRGANIEKLRSEENELLHDARLTVCSSPVLAAEKSGSRGTAAFLPNGVDYRHFSHHSRLPDSDPNDLARVPAPRAVYMGSITHVLDFTLLRDVARLLPEVSFVFVGAARLVDRAIRPVFEEWAESPNVYLLGQKPASVLPYYLQESDVALLPYLITDDTKQRYPLKLHEYMAAGKPIVSTRLNCVGEFGSLVTQATTAEEWARAIQANLSPRDDGAIEERRRVARRHDWNRVVMKLEALVGRAMTSSGTEAR